MQRAACTVNVAPWPSPALAASTVPPCSSTSCLHERQAEAQAAVAALAAAVGLAEALEDVGQEVGADALAGVGHHDLDVGVHARQPDLHPPVRAA